MPPSAAVEYDTHLANDMMDELNLSTGSAVKRAILALFLCGLGAVILIAMLSYNPFDTTFDTAGIGETQNALGPIGAGSSNLIMQVIGWGGILLGGLTLFTGIRGIFKPRPKSTRLDRWRRATLLLGAVIFGTATLSAFPIPQSWPMATGIGGWLGDGIYLNFKGALDHFNIPIAGLIVAIFTFVIAAFCLGRFIGIVGRDLVDIWDAAGLVWATIRVWIDRLVALLSTLFHKRFASKSGSASNLHRDHVTHSLNTSLTNGRSHSETIDHMIRTSAAYAPIDASTTRSAPPPTSKSARKPRTSVKKKPALRSAAKTPEFQFPEGSEFVLPTLDLLKTPPPRSAITDEGALRRASENLHRVMAEYGIQGDMGAVRPGPVVTLFEFEPAPGVKSKRIIGLANDIARNMSAQSARIAVVPGRNAMGVELPNRRRETVWLKDMLSSRDFQDSEAGLPLIMGEDIGGSPFIADLSKMPHLLVAGTTGSGKSVAVNAMILSLMYKLTPEQCKFIMIDPKMLELSIYDNAPHLLAPVVTEPKKAVVALKWTVREMEDRYRKMSKMGVRNMAGYNEKVAEAKARGEIITKTTMTGYNKETGDPVFETEELNYEPMPFIVVIIDEMADLMMVARKEIEGSVQRLAQMARAAGIHMIMATQRPSTDVITGTIKANFPTRVSFRVGSSIDSRTIINENGAEQLLGNGDMLFMGTGRPRRLHGPFVSDAEVERIAAFVKAQGTPSYLEDITTEREEGPEDPTLAGGGSEGNTLFDQAVAIVANDRKASTSYIQRKLSIGYNRAANLIEKMEQDGMIGPSGPGGKREIFLPEKDSY